MPNWIDGEQVRLVALDETTVTFATPPRLVGSRQNIAAPVWQPARGHGFETSSYSTSSSEDTNGTASPVAVRNRS